MSFDFPTHYRNRMLEIDEDIASLSPDDPPTIVMLGDSLTEAFPPGPVRGRRKMNLGISGDQTILEDAGVLRRIYQVPLARPAEVFLLIGINDISSGKSVAQALERHQQVVEALIKSVPHAKVYIQALMPASSGFAHLHPGVKEMNPVLRQRATEMGLTYVDVYTPMLDATGELREELTTDGVHLTPAGYTVWAEVLENVHR